MLGTKTFTVTTAPASVQEDSAALIWLRPEGFDLAVKYSIYLDGQLRDICRCTDYTIENLLSGKNYEAWVQAEDGQGRSVRSPNVVFETKVQGKKINILDFGAVGGGHTINTQAIQRAIDACPPGGKVVVPAGHYVTGALFLKSNMNLNLEEGSCLMGSGHTADYPVMDYRFEGLETRCYASLINTVEKDGKNLCDITISGEGTIDANGVCLRPQEIKENQGKPGRAVCLRNVDRVYLKGVTIRQSPAWCLHVIYCSDVSMNQINVYTRCDEHGNRYKGIVNGDGIDPDSSSNVAIFHSEIASQDDCIAIKSGRNEEGRRVGIPSENIRVTNCVFNSGFGVAIGSEMSGGVRNVLVEDCRFHNTFSIASIKSPRGRGGVIENIIYRNCTLKNEDTEHSDCKWFRGGLYIDQFYSHDLFDPSEEDVVDEGTPSITDIVMEHIVLDTIGGNAVWLAGLKESPLKNIRLMDIKAEGLRAMEIYNVEQLILENVEVKTK